MEWEDKQYDEMDHCVICGRVLLYEELAEVPDHPELKGDENGCLVCLDCRLK